MVAKAVRLAEAASGLQAKCRLLLTPWRAQWAIGWTARRVWARSIKRDVVALWLAARDSRTPIVAKTAAGSVAAYALSLVDLIPDFIPVLGYVDDLVIVPLGILLAIRLVPPLLMAELRVRAAERDGRPASRSGLAAIVAVWVAAAVAAVWYRCEMWCGKPMSP